MSEDADQSWEQTIREVWAANGLSAADLPPSHDPRMKGMIAILRHGFDRCEAELDRLRQRERDIELRLSDLEERVREVEEQIGLGRTLQ
jgi:hypothetical protein